jgi:phosphomannomutase
MIDMRENPIKTLNDQRVIMVEDYKNSTATNLLDGSVEALQIPKSDVLIYYTEDGSKIAARPSGTEPKIKFYVSVNAPLDRIEDSAKVEAELDQKIKTILQELSII